MVGTSIGRWYLNDSGCAKSARPRFTVGSTIEIMKTHILVGTVGGLWSLEEGRSPSPVAHDAHTVTALARDGERTWAIVDGKTLWVHDGGWRTVASVDGPEATCLAPTATGLILGTEKAHLRHLDGDRLVPLESFETVEDRKSWYTPWGDPADVRSIAATSAPGSPIYVNVHVGGVVRSLDGGRSWTPTLDIEVDVHQVIAHPDRPELVLVAAYDGFGISRDAGASWEFVTAGMHAHYCRAVAIADEVVLISASTGPGGKRPALYRRALDGEREFERCREGLPTWFDDNIDTGCLAAAGPVVVAGTEDGHVFRSLDAGKTWEMIAEGLPAVRCILVA